MLEKYNDRLVVAVYSRIRGNLEEYTMDSTIGRDIGKLYKDIVVDVLKVKIWVCTYEVSDGKYQIEFYFGNSMVLSLYSKATDTAAVVQDNIMQSIIKPYTEKAGGEIGMLSIDRNELINRFISKEINQVLEKYNKKEEVEIEEILAFINEADIPLEEFNPYVDYDNTSRLAKIYKEERSTEAIRMMLYINKNVDEGIGIHDIIKKMEELQCYGISSDDEYYLFYESYEKDMIEIAEEHLEEKLEDSFEVAEMFSPEEIAEMWIDSKSPREVVRDMLEQNSWWDILDCNEPEGVIKDNEGRRIMVCVRG